MFDYKALRRFLEDAGTHYSTSAPTVADWIDEIYIPLAESPRDVSVWEVMQVQQLRDSTSGEWEQPNYAANRAYKVRSILGRDTTGHAGF